VVRGTALTPAQDYPWNRGWSDDRFGSARPVGSGSLFCDGSVHFMSCSVDATTFARLGSRNDGYPITGNYRSLPREPRFVFRVLDRTSSRPVPGREPRHSV
jgi:hypothetical protein